MKQKLLALLGFVTMLSCVEASDGRQFSMDEMIQGCTRAGLDFTIEAKERVVVTPGLRTIFSPDGFFVTTQNKGEGVVYFDRDGAPLSGSISINGESHLFGRYGRCMGVFLTRLPGCGQVHIPEFNTPIKPWIPRP